MTLSIRICTVARSNLRVSCHRSVLQPYAGFQREATKPIQRCIAWQNMTHVKNYWWSKSSTAAPTPGEGPVTSPPLPSTPGLSSEIVNSSPIPNQLDSLSSSTASSELPIESSTPLVEQDPVGAGPLTDISTLSQSVADIPPLKFGDFAELGLITWSPLGLVCKSLEILQVSTGMPWFYTIIVGTLFWRLVVTPANIIGIRNQARLLPYHPKLMAIMEEIKHVDKGDILSMQRLGLQRKKIYEQAGVKVSQLMILPLVQLPVTIGVFFGIKRMCQLPVEQLKHSGVSFLPDLTVADPYYILPILSAIVANVQMTVMKPDIITQDRPEMGHMINGMRILSVFSIPLMAGLPSGLFVSLITGVAAASIQTALQHQPAVRRFLKIPPLSRVGPLPKTSMMDTLKYVIDSIRNFSREAAAPKARRR